MRTFLMIFLSYFYNCRCAHPRSHICSDIRQKGTWWQFHLAWENSKTIYRRTLIWVSNSPHLIAIIQVSITALYAVPFLTTPTPPNFWKVLHFTQYIFGWKVQEGIGLQSKITHHGTYSIGHWQSRIWVFLCDSSVWKRFISCDGAHWQHNSSC